MRVPGWLVIAVAAPLGACHLEAQDDTPDTGGATNGGGQTSGNDGGANGAGATSSGGASSDCPEGDARFCAMVAAHDAVRAAAPGAPTPLPPMTWDADLAAHAQAWADTCPTGHNTANRMVNGQTVGENIYWTSSAMPVKPAVPVEAWAGEGAMYDYATNTCNGAPSSADNLDCGHYTQIVWRASVRVGCGMRTGCNNTFPQQPWVCNYTPAGNILDSRTMLLNKPY